MTFCRRGNDYADVAQPFRLTGRSHGARGDTADAASSTGERRAAANGLLHPPLPSSIPLHPPPCAPPSSFLDRGEGELPDLDPFLIVESETV